MIRPARALARKLLQIWGDIGKAPGVRHIAIGKLGSSIAEQHPLRSKLVNGYFIDCNLRDHIQRMIYFSGLYEPIESYLFLRVLKPGMTVIDVGGNVGQYTLLASGAVSDAGQVHTFEPVPKLADILQHNVGLNPEIKNVTLNRAALSSENTTIRLSLPNEHDLGSYSIAGKVGHEDVQVPAVRLDDYLAEKGVQKVDVIKMDIEGAEIFALRGMLQTISRHRPMIFMEINRPCCRDAGYEVEEIWEFLVSGQQYKVFQIGFTPAESGPIDSFKNVNLTNVIFHQEPLPPSMTSDWTFKGLMQWARGRRP